MAYTIDHIDLNNITEDQRQSLLDKLNEFGLVVLSNIIPPDACDKYVESSVNWLTSILPPLSRATQTWTPENTPTGPRKGMYQSLVGHCPVAWELREKLYPLFASLHATEDLITSIDGATIFPPCKSSAADWPHIDQTTSEKDLVCYQGQVVLTNTTASFRCTPGSHLIHEEIVTEYNLDRKSQWHKFTTDEIEKLKPRFTDWQIPIHVPKGSVILWRSTTIHSAKYVDDPTIYQPDKSWDGWRCVYYICQRPKIHCSKRGLKTIKDAALKGRTTNHWGTKTFPKTGRFAKKHPAVENVLKNPELVVCKNLTPLQRRLVGLD